MRAPTPNLLIPLLVTLVALFPGCGGSRRAAKPVPEPDPYTLKQRNDRKLKSKKLEVSLRYLEANEGQRPFGVIRLSNRTRAPIYPQMEEITLLAPGAEPVNLKPACDRERRPRPRLSPREALWCANFANPGYSIDVPLVLPEAPSEGRPLRFDLVVPIVFDEGEPVVVRFANRVRIDDWDLLLPAQ